MTNLFGSLFRSSVRMAESTLLMMNSGLRTMQTAVDRLAGQESSRPQVTPPVDGPPTLDDATSDLATRLMRVAWTTPMDPKSLPTVVADSLNAARSSFAAVEVKTPRQMLAFPLQLPLSFATLATQSALRGFYSAAIVGPEKVLPFVGYMMDSFNDIHVFVSLQYKEYVGRLREKVAAEPENARARLELGKNYIKLGLYEEAAEQLLLAARDFSVKAEALRNSAVANFRCGRFADAVSNASASLSVEPGNARAKYWMWQSAQKLGGYPADVPGQQRIQVKVGWEKPSVEFEEISARIGLDKTAAGRGSAIFDMDGDGYLDVVIASAHGGINLYRNNGDGTFTDATVGSGLDECVNTFVITVGDYNNDGLDDLYITRLGFYQGDSLLYRNNGDGTFTDVTKEAGVGCWGAAFSAQWVDYDCDGHLDLFVCLNLGSLFDRKTPNRLFHNNGDGTFTEVSEQAGIVTLDPTIGGAWGDYDNDGFPDLFVSNGVGRSQLFRNNGNGTFTDVSREAGIDDVCFGSVSVWCDYDNDGWLDLVQFTWSPEEHVLYTLMNGEAPPDGKPMRIYHNNRDGTFSRLDRELGLNGCWGTMSANCGDFNNDGKIDFWLGNGDPRMDRLEPAVMLMSDGDGKYHNVTFAAGLPFTGKGHGANIADLGGDGRLCLMMITGGAYPADLMTTSVFRPKTLPGNYINIRLTGTRSNRNAIGARLKLAAGGRVQHRLVGGGTSFGCLPFEQHFGLAGIARIDSLEIAWPGGGKQRVEGLPVNSTIRIVEGRPGWEEVYRTTAPSVRAAAR
jgi:hypothetical protein